jgi:hypothetical protein
VGIGDTSCSTTVKAASLERDDGSTILTCRNLRDAWPLGRRLQRRVVRRIIRKRNESHRSAGNA